jgi:hypothetical protein
MSIYNAREQRLLKIPDIVIQCIRTGLHASLLWMCSVPKSCILRASSVSVPRLRLGASMLATGFLGNCGRRSPLTTCLHGHPESPRRCSCQTIDSVRKTYPALFVATEDSRFLDSTVIPHSLTEVCSKRLSSVSHSHGQRSSTRT